jgi:CDP-diacylglycerol---serine O-phosphatidyltransferase
VDFRKTYYVLPNLFTLACVLSGFTSLSLSATGKSEVNLYLAALAICFGFFFDTVDGRVARLTKTQSELGRELDSLADVITFGAAPALLVYQWGLSSFGRLGVLFAGLYVCAGALRLARFNVLSRREELSGLKKPGKYTVGLSIPPAASVLVLMVILSHHAARLQGLGEGYVRVLSDSATAAIVLVLSALMVSRVRFRSFKDLRLNRKLAATLLVVGGVYGGIRYADQPGALIFLLLVAAYIGLGLAEEIIFFRSRRAEARAAREVQAAQPELPEPAREEEVLRELGAYDEPEDDGAAPPPDPAPKRA